MGDIFSRKDMDLPDGSIIALPVGISFRSLSSKGRYAITACVGGQVLYSGSSAAGRTALLKSILAAAKVVKENMSEDIYPNGFQSRGDGITLRHNKRDDSYNFSLTYPDVRTGRSLRTNLRIGKSDNYMLNYNLIHARAVKKRNDGLREYKEEYLKRLDNFIQVISKFVGVVE